MFVKNCLLVSTKFIIHVLLEQESVEIILVLLSGAAYRELSDHINVNNPWFIL